MNSPPVIGVSTYYVDAKWGPWDQPVALTPAPYFELVGSAGGRPVLVPPLRDATDDPGEADDAVIGVLDALVLVGGGDLDPSWYGADDHGELGGVDPDRDRAEMALLRAALARDLPVLAICRGLQVLNVHLGGTLVPHLPDVVGHRGHQPAPGRFAEVEVTTVAGTVTGDLFGPRDKVRCSHHQAIDRLGQGLVVTARSVEPEHTPPVIEAVELVGSPFVVGVQWHPEESRDPRLFEAVVHAAKKAR